MRLLTIDIGSYTHGDFLLELQKMGIPFRNLYYYFEKNNAEIKYHNDEFESLLRKELESPYDAVFTTNFYPIIARICHEKGIRYLAWSYDTPINLPSAEEMEHPTNYVFLFDREEYLKYQKQGFEHFYHLPLAVNCDRLDQIRLSDNRFVTDVSLVGALYESTLPVLTGSMTPYQSGYIDALVQAQMRVYGLWFVEKLLSEKLIEGINAQYRELSSSAMQINRAQLAYAIAQQITHIERIALLRLLVKAGMQVDLYTYPMAEHEKNLLREIRVHGTVSYAEEMPALFKSSRINLNPTLKNIASGIPLRALDILGCGGFLLTNWQPEIAEHFVDGEEVVMYTEIEEAVEKAVFYLRNEELRKKVALGGYRRVRQDFCYEDRIREMLRIAGLCE